ncbi:hypothetical protein D1007_14148 [Hordeum vulgare]|nr:hypothetical protein D1007_14148 [Hordeum vulgare]
MDVLEKDGSPRPLSPHPTTPASCPFLVVVAGPSPTPTPIKLSPPTSPRSPLSVVGGFGSGSCGRGSLAALHPLGNLFWALDGVVDESGFKCDLAPAVVVSSMVQQPVARSRKFAPRGRGRAASSPSDESGWSKETRRRRGSGKFPTHSPAPDMLGTPPVAPLVVPVCSRSSSPSSCAYIPLIVASLAAVRPIVVLAYGLGLRGCSLFALDRDPPHVATAPSLSNVVVSYVQGQKITPQILLEGLRVWVVDGCDWQVNQLSYFEFDVVFHSSERLMMVASCTSFTLPLNQLLISIKVASNGSKSVGQLSKVWVLVEDVPAELRSIPFLMAFAVLLGKPVEVDGESLTRLGPVRLRIWCVDPMDVFPSVYVIRLRVRLERAEAFHAPLPPPPPAPSSLEKHDDGSAGGGKNPSGVNEKTAPVVTPISGVGSNMPVIPLSPSTSGIEDLASSPTRAVMAPVSKKKKSTVRKAQILEHVVDFFSSLYAARSESGMSISHSLWDAPSRISPAENDALILPLSDEEIWEALVCSIIQGFCLGTVDISRLNHDVISLIPKVNGAELISQFRPIALISNMTIFPAKGFATRLSPVAHLALSPFQFAFIKGRFIFDGILCLHEIVHDLKPRNSKAVILKLDLEKAYDSVNWPFLRQVLLAKGFDGAYVHQIMQLVLGGHTAISVNGQVSTFFANGRGLRQGDPLSPILFNFVVDALSRILSRVAASGHISPVISHLIPHRVPHLKYADNTIIMVESNDSCLAHLKFIMLCFEASSGLKINFAKSEVIITRVDDVEALRVAHLLNCNLDSFPFKYLGLPIALDKLCAKEFAPIVTKVGNRVLLWRSIYITNVGKVALINSCLSSLPMFIMGFYLVSAACMFQQQWRLFTKHEGRDYFDLLLSKIRASSSSLLR